MSDASTIDVQSPDELSERDKKLALLRSADSDSVKEIAKDAYSQLAAIRNAMIPLEEDYALALQILRERLIAEERNVINDAEFFIGFEPVAGGSATKDEAAIYDALRTIVVDGDPLPEDEIRGAAWLVPPPPPPEPVKKTNLTKLKALAKKYGAPVQAIIDRHVQYPPPSKRFVFQPKEKNVNDSTRAIAGDSKPS